MAKKLLIISAILVFISGVLFGWTQIRILKSEKAGDLPTETTEQPGLFASQNSQDGPLFTQEAVNFQNEIQAKIQGGSVPTKPYFSTDIQIVDVYPEGLGDSQIPYYQTEYHPLENEFRIFLYQFPLAETRLRAEKFFLQKMGITEQQACMLKVLVLVTPSASESLAWQNLGLSFCPGSMDLSPYTENTDGVGNAEQAQPSDIAL